MNKKSMRSTRAVRFSNQEEKSRNRKRMQKLRTDRNYTDQESAARSASLACRHTTSFEELQ